MVETKQNVVETEMSKNDVKSAVVVGRKNKNDFRKKTEIL